MLTSVGVLHPWRSTSGRFPPSSFGPGPAGHWGCPGAPSPPAMTPHAEVFQPQTSRPPQHLSPRVEEEGPYWDLGRGALAASLGTAHCAMAEAALGQL